jgi:dienelactone hydrolase
MGLRLVQSGQGEIRDLVVVYHLTAELDRAVREAAPRAIIVNDTRPHARRAEYRRTTIGGIATFEHLIEWARSEACALAVGRVVLVGYSAGCQAVRTHLADGAEPAAVVTIDGTHASDPPLLWQIDVWRQLATRARASDAVWIATHTQIVPPDFLSTKSVLSRATGWPLSSVDAVAMEGELTVRSYPGADAEAHRRQAREVLPAMLAQAMEALDRLRSGADTDRSPSSLAPGTTLGEATLARAVADLGVREGRDDDRITEYCRPWGLRPPLSWCAVSASHWLRMGAADLGRPAPVEGSPGARALGAQCRAAGRWVARQAIVPELHLQPGQLLVWARGRIQDPTEWRGHVGLLERVDGRTLATVEGNSGPRGDRVARMTRRLDDPALLGLGLLTTPEEAQGARAVHHEPSAWELAEVERLWRLGAEIPLGEPADPLQPLRERLEREAASRG